MQVGGSAFLKKCWLRNCDGRLRRFGESGRGVNESYFRRLDDGEKFIYNSIQLNKVVGRELNENPFKARND